jgi:dihydrofolate synthase/folylpolyglutamate synthase
MLATIQMESGLRVGLFVSPHLKDYRERIRINGKMIPKNYVVRFAEANKAAFEKIEPSFFEMTVGLACSWFRDEKTDIAIMEVGLGGRLDSTNIITPLVSVITNISFDHKQFLGDTLEKIATEKAGIIKPGVPVVIGETQAGIRELFRDKAKAGGCGILFADSLFRITLESGLRDKPGSNLQLEIEKEGKPFISGLRCPLTGNYQKRNIITVLGTIETLNRKGFQIPVHQIKKGIRNVIKNTHLMGRWQVLSHSPLIICDTGHNEAGLTEVIAQINHTPHRHLHFVFGVVNDKEIGPILAILPLTATYYFCKADIPRGLDAGELRETALKAGLKGNAYLSVNEALDAAKRNAGPGDLIFIGGSTFVVAEVV